VKNVRGDARTVVIALIAGLIGANAPAIAHGIDHALFAHNAEKIDGIDAVTAGAKDKAVKLVATRKTGLLPRGVIPKADAGTLDGKNSTYFSPADHTHPAGDIVSGTLGLDRLPGEVTQDSEVLGIVTDADGSGSGLDADTLDGSNSGDFAAAAEAVPAGAVSFFNLATCPNGWSELTTARGRYLVGLPSGGTLTATAGTALTDLENRAVGQHNHGITDPGHSHVIQGGGSTHEVESGNGSFPGGPWVLRDALTNTTGITINNAGSVAGTNAPYLQLLVCQKD
jgi:hypothetical protein